MQSVVVCTFGPLSPVMKDCICKVSEMFDIKHRETDRCKFDRTILNKGCDVRRCCLQAIGDQFDCCCLIFIVKKMAPCYDRRGCGKDPRVVVVIPAAYDSATTRNSKHLLITSFSRS